MFKTISAAVLAVSVLAAPALAATGKATTQTAVIKTTRSKATQSKASPVKTRVHHLKYGRHHNEHKKIAMRRTHPKVSYKHTLPALTKRG